LADRPVRVERAEAFGCFIGRTGPAAASGAVTYCKDVAPILRGHCQRCHRPGQVAPFSLLTFKQAVSWAEPIREVVQERRMPPWHADPRHGRFANDPSLSEAQRQTLFAWIDAGCPEGDPADLPPPAKFPDGGGLADPDLVLTIPEPFTVPAEGVIEYQYF